MPISSPPYAALTGDLVASSRLSARQLRSVRALLEEGVEKMRGWGQDLVHRGPEFFQGDAWQLLLRQPAPALRASLFLRAVLQAASPVQTRISIGLGWVDELSANGLGSSTGEAFTLSGRGLREMKNRQWLALQLPDRVGCLSPWVRLSTAFCDVLAGEHTQRQADVLCHALHPASLTHEQIRLRLDRTVSRQTVTKSLQSLHWPVLRDALETFETTDWTDLLQPSPSSSNL
ncbi:MAG: hypothetical protein GVY10_07720 [Verrucomicrobia bacterium]|jgi:hypothetical protein|nr:hypothetical protein [Verrucomicrobiota bacterium]